MTIPFSEITLTLADLNHSLSCVSRMMDAMDILSSNEDENDDDIINAMVSAMRGVVTEAQSLFDEVTAWCRAMDMDRIEREKLAIDMRDSEEGQALRDLSRTMARQIEAICLPAMRAITEMQNRAGDIDAMVRRARDMAGCLKPIHHADRDPDKPEAGSLRAVVQEAMASGREVSA